MAKDINKYQVYNLDNGLQVVTKHTPTLTIKAQLSVYYATAHERLGEEGLAHFLEHCLASGGSQKYSPDEIFSLKARLGYCGAFTSLNETTFPAGMMSSGLETYLDMTSDLVFHPTFDHRKIDEERLRILREIADNKGRPEYIDRRKAREAFFGKGSIYTKEIFGNEKVVHDTTVEDISDFHARGYGSSNMQLLLIGGLPKNVDELVLRYFGDKPAGINTKLKLPPLSYLTKRTIIHTSAPDLINDANPSESNSYISLAFRGVTLLSPDFPVYIILDGILGEGKDSRLFQAISQRRGFAYHIHSGRHTLGNAAGVLEIEGKIASKRQEEALDCIFEQFKLLQEKGPSLEEVEIRRNKEEYQMAERFESNLGIGANIRAELEYGISDIDITNAIHNVTPLDVQRAAQTYLPSSRDSENYVLLIRDPLKV